MNKKTKLNSKKLIILINNLSFFCSHRLPIAEAALNKSFNVIIGYGELGGVDPTYLTKKGFKLNFVPMQRGGIDLFNNLKTFFYIWRFLRKEKPDIVHLITIKPYLFGGVLARITGVRGVISAVSGLGSLFISRDLKSKLLRFLIYPLYKVAFNHSNQIIIFHNNEDPRYLLKWGVLSKNKIRLLKGSGVNLNEFTKFNEHIGIPVVCFASRLLIDKGVYEFISAARILRDRSIKARFLLVGDLDTNNPTGLDNDDLTKINSKNIVEFLGYQDDIPSLFEKSHIICLPSYREGLPKVLIEAAAASRAIVTTDVPGCRDAIIPNKTGLIVPVRNSEALANAIQDLLENSEKRVAMGRAGRELAEKEYAIENIVEAHLEIYNELIKKSSTQ